MRSSSSRFVVLLAVAFLSLPRAASAAEDTVASTGDASIAHDAGAGTWTLTAAGATLTLSLDATRDFQIAKLTSPSGAAWNVDSVSDSQIHINDRTIAFGSRTAGFRLADVSAHSDDRTLRLDAAFDLTSAGLRVTRHYAVVSGSPTFEVWTTFAPTGDARTVSDLDGLRLTVPAGKIRWLTGLRGDSADVANDSAFTLREQTLGAGEHLTIGSDTRSSTDAIPWFAIDGEHDEFYAAIMWSGGWSLDVERTTAGLAFNLGLSAMTTTVRAAVDGPHVLFGIVNGNLPAATAALRGYIVQGVRGGRPVTPLITANTWYSYGVRLDDRIVRREIDSAWAVGAELFVIDAGWYYGAGANGPFDFEAGLGNWTVDHGRFPDGLRPLADHAHELGLKFGLWFEPERVDRSLVPDGGVDESWLAQRDSSYQSDRTAQICLASPRARAWLMNQLTAILDEVRPDYLKWDNNFWINCNRDGHGHGTSDGNFAHVAALYDMFAALRARYPDMLIENVAGGGNRLDLGMLRYTDAGWMDDRTAPSLHVRHNIEGLSAIFPPAYLLSFVTNNQAEPIHDAPDLPLYMRSRMMGALGLSVPYVDIDEAVGSTITHEIDIYKAMRGTLGDGSVTLLSAQTAADGGPPWDVVQETSASGAKIVISAFQTDPGVDRVTVRPVGLQPTGIYDVQSVDNGPLGSMKGGALMEDGIDVIASPNSAAHILFLTVRQP